MNKKRSDMSKLFARINATAGFVRVNTTILELGVAFSFTIESGLSIALISVLLVLLVPYYVNIIIDIFIDIHLTIKTYQDVPQAKSIAILSDLNNYVIINEC